MLRAGGATVVVRKRLLRRDSGRGVSAPSADNSRAEGLGAVAAEDLLLPVLTSRLPYREMCLIWGDKAPVTSSASMFGHWWKSGIIPVIAALVPEYCGRIDCNKNFFEESKDKTSCPSLAGVDPLTFDIQRANVCLRRERGEKKILHLPSVVSPFQARVVFPCIKIWLPTFKSEFICILMSIALYDLFSRENKGLSEK